MMNSVKLCTAAFLLALPYAANAEIIRCEVTDRSHRLMPEWIEYELRERDTVVEVRDSVGARFGVDWVRGRVAENTGQRFTIVWDNGVIPRQDDWPYAGRVVTRLTVLANGDTLVTGIPAYGLNTTIRYSGRAACA